MAQVYEDIVHVELERNSPIKTQEGMTLVSLDNDNNKFDARQRENGKSTQV